MNQTLENPAQKLWQDQPVEGIKMSPDAIRMRAGKFERRIWRRNVREYVASALAILGFAYFFATAHSVLFRISYGLFIAAMAWMMFQLHRKGSARNMAAAVGSSTCLEFFRAELERQRDLVINIWPWYLAPLVPGFAVFTVADALAVPRPSGWALLALIDGVVAILFLLIWKMNMRAGRCLQRMIDELSAAEGKR